MSDLLPTRRGDWMQLASGKAFYPLDPRPEDIELADIAGALSRVCRFGGHVSAFYSVAQHSVLVSQVCDPADALWGLLHDASEAYLGDLIRPLKRQPECAGYCAAEARLMAVICERFGLPPEMPASVARADEVLLATEARDLMGNAALERWSSLAGIEPLREPIRFGWDPRHAEHTFHSVYRGLTEGRHV